jgi:hypothetical protein
MDTTAKIGSPSDCLLAYRHSESVLKHDESILAGAQDRPPSPPEIGAGTLRLSRPPRSSGYRC